MSEWLGGKESAGKELELAIFLYACQGEALNGARSDESPTPPARGVTLREVQKLDDIDGEEVREVQVRKNKNKDGEGADDLAAGKGS